MAFLEKLKYNESKAIKYRLMIDKEMNNISLKVSDDLILALFSGGSFFIRLPKNSCPYDSVALDFFNNLTKKSLTAKQHPY